MEDIMNIEENTTTPGKLVTGILIIVTVFFSVFIAFCVLRHRRLIAIIIQTFSRDTQGIIRFIRTFRGLKKCEKSEAAVSDIFDSTVERFGSKVCFQFEDDEWTFREVWERSNQVANYFQGQGYKKGDIVSLFMENRPEYVCIWMGLSKLGVLISLINSNIRLQQLKHSFKIANSKAIIYGEELSTALAEVLQDDFDTEKNIELFAVGSLKCDATTAPSFSSNSDALKERTVDLGELLDKASSSNLELAEGEKPTFHDSLFYIYTSGTTGLPKAAIIKHARFMMAAISFHHLNVLSDSDVIYTCLPLYHMAGGLCGVGQALFFGNTVILRKRFSASKFWKDCVQHKVTIAQYIGEICRYLLSQPVTLEEKQHGIRIMVGNGLRAEIWKEFVDRFKIAHVSEIYGSTDGNCNMVNWDNRVGAVGFVPVFLNKLYPMGLIKVDETTGEPVRSTDTGLVVRCKPNEPGELVGTIIQNHPIREFQGYAKDSKSTEKKIIRDVFSMGDVVFRTGDYLVRDEFGYFYFKDRAGDTYRWKGENVSTAEIEAVISTICDLKDSVVYGVSVPGTDGKAGMATVADPTNSLNLDVFADGVYKALPSYARPLFLRVSKEIETTGTHKLKKVELQNAGFDVTKIKEPIYFYTNGKYVRLDEDLYLKIIGAKIRV